MDTSVLRGAKHAKRVSSPTRTLGLSLMGVAIASFSAWAQAADAVTSRLDITGISYTASAYGASTGTAPTVVMGGAPLKAYFFQEYDYSQAALPSAVSADGTRQVQMDASSWSMTSQVSDQDVANLWAHDPMPGAANAGRLGVQISSVPPELLVPLSSDPNDYLQVTLSPHSQLTWSATMDLSIALDPQLLADTLQSQATDTVHPALQMAGVFYGNALPIGASDEQVAVLNAQGFDAINEGVAISLEFDAQGRWTQDGTPGHTARELHLTLYNPFDTELTYGLDLFAAQELAFFRNNAQLDPTSVPEPGTWALMGLGLVGLALCKRRGPIGHIEN